jgi:hypothetical protein
MGKSALTLENWPENDSSMQTPIPSGLACPLMTDADRPAADVALKPKYRGIQLSIDEYPANAEGGSEVKAENEFSTYRPNFAGFLIEGLERKGHERAFSHPQSARRGVHSPAFSCYLEPPHAQTQTKSLDVLRRIRKMRYLNTMLRNGAPDRLVTCLKFQNLD